MLIPVKAENHHKQGADTMKTMTTIIILLLAFNARADEMLLNINLHAHHWSREAVKKYDLNEVNPGIGLEFQDGSIRKMVGVYKNSDRRYSAYALLGWMPVKIGPVDVGVFGGVVTGYAKPYEPAAGMIASIELTKKVNLNITAVPTIEEYRVFGFCAFQLAYKF